MTELSTLRSLSLKATRVTDDGLLQHIPQLPELQDLSLAYLDISDASLLALESVAWLERLNLRHTALTNDGIVSLVCGKAHTLRQLDLANTVINDESLAECLPNFQLNNLSLIDTGITDDACRECAGCEWLADLRLDLTDITDDGVRHLTHCMHLQSLDLFAVAHGGTPPSRASTPIGGGGYRRKWLGASTRSDSEVARAVSGYHCRV